VKLYFQSIVSNYILDLLDTPGKEQHRGKLNCVGLAFIDAIIPTNSLAEIMAMQGRIQEFKKGGSFKRVRAERAERT